MSDAILPSLKRVCHFTTYV